MRNIFLLMILLSLGIKSVYACEVYTSIYITRPNAKHMTIIYPDRQSLFRDLSRSIKNKASLPTTETFFIQNVSVCKNSGEIDYDFPAAVMVGTNSGQAKALALSKEESDRITKMRTSQRFPDKNFEE